MCWDVDLDAHAEQYGTIALMLAREAGANESYAWYAQAKNRPLARPSHRSRRPLPAGLRGQPADADEHATRLAREAVTRAEQSAQTIHDSTSDLSVWSFPDERQALFALSVANRTGDPDRALRAAEMADTAWANGAPVAPAIWAQIRVEPE
jgi:hypothetical protein